MALSSSSARKWAFGGLIAGSALLLSVVTLIPALLADATGRPVTFVPDFAHASNKDSASSQIARLRLPELEDVLIGLRETTAEERLASVDWSASIANRTLGVS